MFVPQVDWLCDEQGRMLADFVGRFERLAADFAVICEVLGVERSLPHLKSSGKGDYRSYYDEETREVVARCFARDVERFGYAFDAFEGPLLRADR